MIEKLEKLKEDITRIQGIMITVSTGRGNIDDFEEEYRKLYFSIKEQLKNFRKEGIRFPDLNFFSSLWDFYSHWKAEFKTYQERREYVRSLYKPIDDAITQVLMKAYNKTIDSNNLEKILSSIVEESVENKESKSIPSTIGASEGSADEFEHDIAISFAGEDRETAEDIANALITEGVKVFYDRFYKVDMWGKKLTSYFQNIYGPKARFVMVLISKHYPIKDWTDFEFSIARGEAKKRKTEFILPVRLDDTKILGIHEDVGYLDLETEGIKGIIDAVIEKLPKRKELHIKITKGIFVTTLGVNFEDLVENKIISKDDWRNYPRTCDKLEADLKGKLDKSAIGEYHFTEPSARSGETLSVRFAHFWDTSRGLPDLAFTDYWDFLEFRPVEEIYPDTHKEVKSMFRGLAFVKGKIPLISGRWLDRADEDIVFFQQRGNKVIGIYDFDGRKSKVGFYIGVIKGNSFEYEWRWFDGEFQGHGRMMVPDDNKTLSGLWWYGDDESSPEHVGYERVDDKMPSWLTEKDFNEIWILHMKKNRKKGTQP